MNSPVPPTSALRGWCSALACSRRLIPIAVIAFNPLAHAQPTAPAPTPTSVLTKLQSHYRAAPTCERMQIEVKSDNGRTARSWAVVRLNPKPEPSILLELGPLRIAADARTLTAIHQRNPQTCYTAKLPGDGPLTPTRLAQLLPPVPLPQLDLLLADDTFRFSAFAAYAKEVNWSTATADPRQPAKVTLDGQSDRGKVTLTARGDQLLSLELRDEQRAVAIRMTFAPVAPCRSDDIKLDVGGGAVGVGSRTHVDQLSDLQARVGILRTGAPVPELQLSTSAGQIQKLRGLLAPPAEYLPAPEAERLLLVLTRRARSDPAQTVHTGRIDLAILGRELVKMQREAYVPSDIPGSKPDHEHPLLPTFNFVQVAVLEAPSADSLLALIKHEREAWGDHLAWTTDAKASIDLFAVTGESLAIIIDQQQHLRSVIPISDRATTEEFVDQLTAALIETASDEP